VTVRVTSADVAAPERVLHLETLALRAWPARVVEACGGWRLRWGDEGTWRTRSVWPNGGSHGDLAAWIARAEAFYATRGEPARFQVTDAATPRDLDAQLAARGYTIEPSKSSHVLYGAIEGLLAERPGAAAPWRIEIEDRASAAWLAAYQTCVGVPDALLPARRALFARIAPDRRHACLRDGNGEAVATCLGVVEEGWLGLYALGTRPARRRAGAARALLAALAADACERGAARVYLQVERDNAAALALYARAGCRRHHDYHYRVAPGGAAARG
jgi:ribosomal protein S18 acetylase RimI-like enzyme